jgi:hypothetical protein
MHGFLFGGLCRSGVFLRKLTTGEVMKALVLAAGGAIALLGFLTGCAVPSISLTNSEANVAACSDRSPVRVGDLAARARLKCDLAGVEIVFPGGERELAPHVLASMNSQEIVHKTQPGRAFGLSNLGIYGVIADEVSVDGKRTQWWGSKVGLNKTWAAFGKTGVTNIDK